MCTGGDILASAGCGLAHSLPRTDAARWAVQQPGRHALLPWFLLPTPGIWQASFLTLKCDLNLGLCATGGAGHGRSVERESRLAGLICQMMRV